MDEIRETLPELEMPNFGGRNSKNTRMTTPLSTWMYVVGFTTPIEAR